MSTRSASLLLVAALAASSASDAATFQFRFSGDFNDTTPVTPVGGNTATTLGAARRAVFEEAGRVWGALLQSDVPIIVDASFAPLTCTASSGTLGQAGPSTAFTFTDDPTTAYVSALADARAGKDLIGESNNPTRPDITAQFSSSLNGSAGCLQGATFYLGFDHNRGTQIDLLAVVLHELGHGLGFFAGVNLTTGESLTAPSFFSFATQLFDEQSNQSWPLLTSAERVQSATRTGSLAWNGTNVRRYRNRLTAGVTTGGRPRMFAPNPVQAGSSVSHWDTLAAPNLLMEPTITGGLTSRVDFTTCALRDLGWTVRRCPDSLNATPQVATQTFTATEDTAVNLTIVGTDADADTLTFAVVTNPARGSVSLSANGQNLTYTPNANLNGNDTFTVTASDGVDTSASATITVNVAAVNDAPTAAPTSAAVQAGRSVNIPGVGADVDGDTLTYSVVSAPANGTATASGNGITYTANANFSGTDSFTYRANDASTSSAPATVTVTVTPPPQSGGGGGGGDMGGLLVALLSAGAVLRRRRGTAR